MSTDKLAFYDNVMGVFNDLDDGGITESEALLEIRRIANKKMPLPEQLVLTGTLPFTVTVRTDTVEVAEFEVNYDYPNWDRAEGPELRASGEKLDPDLYEDGAIDALYDAVDSLTGDWPEPERM